jgi:ankyrin repeat protein
LAKLHIDSLVGKRSLRAVRDALKNLLSISKTDDSAKVYDSAYRDAMERISGQVPDQAEMAKQVLAFIVHTREPLTGAALQEALGIEIGDRRFDPDNCPAVDDMISACAGLVTLDIGEGVIRLVHYTAREFFQRTQQTWFPDAEAMITRICATFIAMERTSFANSLGRYAKRNWGYHAALAPSAVTQALEFLLQPDKVEYAAGWGSDYREFQFREVYDERKTTGMHLAAFHGLDAIIPAILHAQPDTATSKGLTPLMIAGMRGHVSTLRLLLDYNVAVDAVDSLHQTALWLAAREGRTAVGRALIDSRAHCMIAAASGSTPLHVATLNHHDAFVQLLIERGANLDEPNKHGEIALFMAAQGDEHHAGVMRLLLDAGTEVNYRSEDKWSPLHAACEGGCEILIRLLLDAGADVNSQNQQGTSPLHIACELGYLDIVDILLVAGADANLHDDKAITPLEAACRQGHEQVALLLLDAGADVQRVNHYGGSPLHAACVFGYGLDIIRRLLLMGAVVNLRDTTGRTPLFYAGIKGYRVIKLLLDAGAEADCLDNDGIPLLSGPCGLGHERSLEYLLAAGADVNLGSEQGFSPLLDATNSDEEAIVRHLIHHGAQVDCVDREGRSALFYAARNGSESLVRLLLGHVTDVKLDCMGRSPLFLMTGDPSAGVVRLLLDQGMDPNIQDEFGDTASSFARSVLEQQGTRVIQPLVSSVRKQVHTDVTGLNFIKEPSTAQPDLSHRKDAEVNAGEASSEDTADHTPIITEEEKHASANEPIKTLTSTSEQNEDQHLSIPLDSDVDPDSDSDSDDSHPTAAPSLSSFYTTYLCPEDSDWTADVRACIALLEGRTPSPASVSFHPPLDPESDYINRAERPEVGGEIAESESPVDESETGSEDSDDYRPRVRYFRRETNDDK